jgi:general secretion pathway protein G
MKKILKTTAHAQRGMTLIEIMVVVVIISLMTGVIGVSVFTSLNKASEETTRTQIKNLEEAVDLYHLSHHRFPSTAEGLAILTQSTPQSAAIMKEVPLDAWQKPFVYIQPGSHNPDSFDIMSYGKDGTEGGGDDVGNWTNK